MWWGRPRLRWLALALTLVATASKAEPERLSEIIFEPAGIGGLSAIAVSSDGTEFTALSDNADYIHGTILRDGDIISGFAIFETVELRGPNGGDLRPRQKDSEGIAIRADGRIFISFERNHRIWAYDRPDQPPVIYRRAQDFETLPNNAGLEALALSPSGNLIAIPEHNDGPVPIYEYSNDWRIAGYLPVPQGFHVTGADYGPDGLLYLLERRFTGISFATRITRVNADGRYEVILQTPVWTHGNLEGISVWRDDAGALRATMVSDNNESPFVRGKLVEYRLGQ